MDNRSTICTCNGENFRSAFETLEKAVIEKNKQLFHLAQELRQLKERNDLVETLYDSAKKKLVEHERSKTPAW